ncbi:hypothetical protein V5O48_014942 [Marasmius crinis-equi]|uniref:CxC1-like cysteine cluster associated with KDZ transposases domain-containing protein n=1 Tax=Marasmius crinis-equi TaxID=585013 RepID=A0ABR3EVX3_9AGAR
MARMRYLHAQVEEMKRPHEPPAPSSALSSSSQNPLAQTTTPSPPPEARVDADSQDDPPESQYHQHDQEMVEDALPPVSAASPAKKTKKDEQEDLTRRWKELLVELVDPLLKYWDRTVGVYPEDHRVKTFNYCQCRSLAEALVLHGLFPTSPLKPRMAISIVLLDFYQALCQHSSDADPQYVRAVLVNLQRILTLTSIQGEALQDPIRRALGQSLQWYDALVVQIDRYLLAKVDRMKATLPPLPDTVSTLSSPLRLSTALSMVSPSSINTSGSSSAIDPSQPSVPQPALRSVEAPLDVSQIEPGTVGQPRSDARLQYGSAHSYLQRLCPACFGGRLFGRSFQVGGDIHIAIDGNFHHRHLKSRGDGTLFCESSWVLLKEAVDVVGQRIDAARAKPPKPRVEVVPDDVVNADQESYKAAHGDKHRASSDAFDERGIMALVCRHDIPLFFASIDTPGEQQKYAVALLEALFAMLPFNAPVAALYDVACVLDRSINLYDMISNSILLRLQLVTTVMHAYGHQWVCQLYYNPRLRVGLGITDGEGVERLWSRLRKLIGIERRASRATRLRILDRQCDAIARDLRQGLRKWIQRRLYKNIQKKETDAVRTIRRNGSSERNGNGRRKLKPQFARDQIDSLEAEIAEVKATIKKMPFPPADATFILPKLEDLHHRLKGEAAQLYTSLNLDDRFPELCDVPLDYLHTLMLARDTKVVIRKKVIGTFFEWDRVDSAVGGAHEAIGTKVHQATRNAITKRAPVIENLIRKFIQFVTQLKKDHKAHYRIPIPERLPTQLALLWDMETSHLWEDVWILQTETPPKWLVNEGVRKGIQAVLNLDRCAEDRVRLSHEATNLCAWFRDELQPSIAKFISTFSDLNYATDILSVLTDTLDVLADTLDILADTLDIFTVLINTLFGAVGDLSYLADILNFHTGTPAAPMDDSDDEIEFIGENNTAEAIALRDVIEEDSEDEEETMTLIWEAPLPLSTDFMLSAAVAQYVFPRQTRAANSPRTFKPPSSRFAAIFNVNQYRRIDNSNARLDDECVNGCAGLLQQAFGAREVNYAILPSFVVPQILQPDYATTPAWSISKRSEYWLKSTWVIPIHDKSMEHWALAVVRVDIEEILIFDSFANRAFISKWVPNIQRVVH